MSKSMLALACGALLVFTGVTFGQGGTAQPCRMAFVNMQEVFSKYEKYSALQAELKAKDEDYMKQVKTKEARVQELQKTYAAKETPQATKDSIEAELRTLKSQMEQIVAEGRKKMTADFDAGLCRIILEFQGGCAQVAKARGYDIIFRYNEDWTGGNEVYGKPENVVRRTMSINFAPVTIPGNMEVTNDVLATMRQLYGAAVQTGGTGAGAGAGVTPAGNR